MNSQHTLNKQEYHSTSCHIYTCCNKIDDRSKRTIMSQKWSTHSLMKRIMAESRAHKVPIMNWLLIVVIQVVTTHDCFYELNFSHYQVFKCIAYLQVLIKYKSNLIPLWATKFIKKGVSVFKCFNLSTHRVILSCIILFDESIW